MQTLVPSANELLKKQQPYAYWLGNINGIGNKTLHSLLEEFHDPLTIYEASREMLSPFLTKKQLENLFHSKTTFLPEVEYQKLLQRKIRFLPCYHPLFPPKLTRIPDPPYAIYFIGSLPKANEPLISIIGARNCSDYGKKVAQYFAQAFASAGIGIISGLARGIDGIAQNAALKAGGKTYGILGCSVDICYPPENTSLYYQIPSNGALISEYPPTTQPRPQLFPARNRIISGLSDALLVVEAKEKSGTLITVDMALEQGREVYAVPGRINDPLSYGCNKLIKQGAGIALSPKDLVTDLCMDYLSADTNSHTQKSTALLSEKEQCILHSLQYEPQAIDEIYHLLAATGKYHDLSIPSLIHTLTQMCLKGYVQNQCGRYSLPVF